jgi:LPXTG-motif cell wall-anchored protein
MRPRPIALSAAAAALVLGGLAAPAQAAPAAPLSDIWVSGGQEVKVPQGGSKTLDVDIYNNGAADADDVVVTFLNVDPNLRLTLPADCTGMSCPVGDVEARDRTHLTVTVEVVGDKARSSFEMRPDDGRGDIVDVERYPEGVDLEVAPIVNPRAGRGQSARVPIIVRNDGTEAVRKFGVAVGTGYGLRPVAGYRDCESFDDVADRKTFGKVPVPGSLGSGPAVFCTFDQEIAPGATFELPVTAPIRIAVDRDLGGPFTYGGWVVAVGLGGAGQSLPGGPSGRNQFGHDDAVPEYNDGDNASSFGVTLDRSAADSAAVGATLSGAIGDRETFEVGVRNLGPTTVIDGIYDLHEHWYPNVRVRIPAGLRLTGVDKDCWPGTGPELENPRKHGVVEGVDYVCDGRGELRTTAVGETVTLAFTGTLTGEDSEAGWVVADGGKQDGNARNDKAAITIALGGSTEGENPGGGGGGGLPITGAPVGWVALGGAVLLIAGAVAAFVFRRRRIVTTL